MARLRGEHFPTLYDAAETIRQECLMSEGSLLFPGEHLWTIPLLQAVDGAMDDDASTGTFAEKLERQLQSLDASGRRLMAEVILVQHLFPSDFRREWKLAAVGQPVPQEDAVWQERPIIGALSFGIGSGGPGYKQNRYWEMKLVLRFFIRWKQLPREEQNQKLQDPWVFKAYFDSLEGATSRQFRHMILHLFFPDTFERISSWSNKRAILREVGRSRGLGATGDVDRDLATIRGLLQEEHGEGSIDFYDTPWVRDLWAPDEDVDEPESSTAYYWLNAMDDPPVLANQPVGAKILVAHHRSDGTLKAVKSCFNAAKPGDLVAGYELTPTQALTCVLKVSTALHDQPEPHGTCIELEIIRRLDPPIPLQTLEGNPMFRSAGRLNQRGAFSKLTQAQFEGLVGSITEVKTVRPLVAEPVEALFVDPLEFDRWVELWRVKKNLILHGPPGVGKTFIARHLARALAGTSDPARIQMIQFHQAYGYEDFVMGYRPTLAGGFEPRKGFFHELCDKAGSEDAPFVLIIDEINRGNLSKIFGETLMLIEADKRNEKYALRLALHQEGEPKFSVPANLYILGLMNNSDRSLAVVDYALRRRFCFVELQPAFKTEVGRATFKDFMKGKGNDAALVHMIIERIGALNEVIEADLRNLGPDLCLGHSFFCNVASRKDYDHVIDHEIAPLLREYWFDNPDLARREISNLKV